MHLVVETANTSDLEVAKALYTKETGDLVAPICAACWLVAPDDIPSLKHRAGWSLQQQLDVLTNDPTAHFVKVVDSDDGAGLIALACWHRYLEGYAPRGDIEICGTKSRQDSEAWPEKLNKALFCAVHDRIISEKQRWIGNIKCWCMDFSPFL